ncbi:hypothetical protein ATL42_0282 [Sanguibacter antarcticus]|uniref:Uncharacterized protein n=1 Tax=Sanguibacter antarcticus TaxID=372484 RepID=A0A2A9E0T0_9MICO|nr:hypothetical protein ATL42_0282 [Sanguibacter antarcticus]
MDFAAGLLAGLLTVLLAGLLVDFVVLPGFAAGRPDRGAERDEDEPVDGRGAGGLDAGGTC